MSKRVALASSSRRAAVPPSLSEARSLSRAASSCQRDLLAALKALPPSIPVATFDQLHLESKHTQDSINKAFQGEVSFFIDGWFVYRVIGNRGRPTLYSLNENALDAAANAAAANAATALSSCQRDLLAALKALPPSMPVASYDQLHLDSKYTPISINKAFQGEVSFFIDGWFVYRVMGNIGRPTLYSLNENALDAAANAAAANAATVLSSCQRDLLAALKALPPSMPVASYDQLHLESKHTHHSINKAFQGENALDAFVANAAADVAANAAAAAAAHAATAASQLKATLTALVRMVPAATATQLGGNDEFFDAAFDGRHSVELDGLTIHRAMDNHRGHYVYSLDEASLAFASLVSSDAAAAVAAANEILHASAARVGEMYASGGVQILMHSTSSFVVRCFTLWGEVVLPDLPSERCALYCADRVEMVLNEPLSFPARIRSGEPGSLVAFQEAIARQRRTMTQATVMRLVVMSLLQFADRVRRRMEGDNVVDVGGRTPPDPVDVAPQHNYLSPPLSSQSPSPVASPPSPSPSSLLDEWLVTNGAGQIKTLIISPRKYNRRIFFYVVLNGVRVLRLWKQSDAESVVDMMRFLDGVAISPRAFHDTFSSGTCSMIPTLLSFASIHQLIHTLLMNRKASVPTSQLVKNKTSTRKRGLKRRFKRRVEGEEELHPPRKQRI